MNVWKNSTHACTLFPREFRLLSVFIVGMKKLKSILQK
jgi:hypothetical protein